MYRYLCKVCRDPVPQKHAVPHVRSGSGEGGRDPCGPYLQLQTLGIGVLRLRRGGETRDCEGGQRIYKGSAAWGTMMVQPFLYHNLEHKSYVYLPELSINLDQFNFTASCLPGMYCTL
jgi:hypothetical protein